MTDDLRRAAERGAAALNSTINWIIRRRRPLIVAAHAVLFSIAYALAFGLRFDFQIPPSEYRNLAAGLPWTVVLQLTAVAFFRLYEGLWRYVGIRDVVQLVKAVTIGSAVSAAGLLLFVGSGFPRSVLILDWLLALGLGGGARICARVLLERSQIEEGGTATNGHRLKVLVAGASDLAEGLLREIARGKLPYRVLGLLDDDPRLRGRRLHGVEVKGRIDDLPVVAAETNPDLVLIASADPEVKRRVATLCRRIGVDVKAIPALHDLLQGRAFIEQLRDVRLDELLGRGSNGSGSSELYEHLSGRRVLVTGAAGSIGSELARQIAAHGPAALALLDRNESELYFTALELSERYPDLDIRGRVGDIADEPFVRRLMRDIEPEFVYHAAAYKHVPLMEGQPIEAVKNNIFGTETLARASIDAGVERFVNVSTDKAVEPVSVMGMTKRVAESVVASLAGHGTTFVSVRFGNVLGSHGSVLPLFHRQVARGGPITITDPEATRYFMLVSEAVELVLHAGRLGRDGEVYVLDMGEPIRIGDLANNLVRSAGLEPEIDVAIQIVGLRPGERLHEHAGVGADELAERSGHNHIFVVRGSEVDERELRRRLNDMRERVIAADAVGTLESLRNVVGVVLRPNFAERTAEEG